MARNAAAVLLLAVSIYAAAGATVGPLTTAVLQETDGAGAEETSSLLPVHRDSHEEEEEEEEEGIEAGRPRGATAGDAASLASAADEEGKGAGSDWGKPSWTTTTRMIPIQTLMKIQVPTPTRVQTLIRTQTLTPIQTLILTTRRRTTTPSKEARSIRLPGGRELPELSTMTTCLE